MRAQVSILFLPVVLLVGVGIGYLLWGRAALQAQALAAQPTATAAAEATAPAAATTPQAVRRYDVPVDDDPVLGPDTAEITLIEFSDYECPFCTKWQQEVFPQLMQAYEGRIRFVYRDFPLYSIHGNAAPAAEAANCAGAQGQYWAYHDLLFNGGKPLSAETYAAYATQVGLDTASFQECLDTHATLAEVQADYEYAADLGIRSTPTFFINGLAIVGAQPYESFKNIIDMELAGQIPD
jgi:protein-disulfide isomerase